MNELYKNNYPPPTAVSNTAILKRLEKDVSALSIQVKELKEVLSFINEYIQLKKVLPAYRVVRLSKNQFNVSGRSSKFIRSDAMFVRTKT